MNWFIIVMISRIITIIMDGSHGVAMQLERKLAQSGMLRQCGEPGTAVFENSLDEPEILALSRALFRYRDE